MCFNPSKCKVLTVTRKKQPTLFGYSMHDQILNRVKSTKYLGVNNNFGPELEQAYKSDSGKGKPGAGLCKEKH